MRKKNLILKHINIRSFKYLFFKLLCRITPLKQFLNLHDERIENHDVENRKIIAEYFCDKKKYFSLAKFNDVTVLGKTALVIDNKTQKGIDLSRNYFKPVIAKKTIKINDCDVINLIGIHKGYKHFFHVFFDYYIPFFHFLKKYYDQKSKLKILVRSDLSSIQLDLINFLQKDFPNIEFIKTKNNEKIICKNLIYFWHDRVTFFNNDVNEHASPLVQSFRDFLVRNYQITEIKNKKFIYISRNDAALRRIKNEEEVFALLKKYNFELKTLSNLNFTSQIELFLNAKFIVGPHGAGFTNIMFCKDDATLLEIFPKHHYDLGYVMLAKNIGMKRYEIIENNESSKQDFLIHLNVLENKILEILKNNRSL